MCDTFVALPNATTDGSVIFAKNSDREANEAQLLEHHPSASFEEESTLKCTYISIPQVAKTNAVLLSRPYWMWGAEMGTNEHGVVIGNEAVFTKLSVTKNGVLTGMDLVRLGLERAKTAMEAKDIIIELLTAHGQGGLAGYQDKSFTYHNSFIIADKKEAWVLETAGEFWVTKKVKSHYAISNGLTIEDDYDEIHPEAVDFARKKGWAKKQFGFASAFSDRLFTRFSDCKHRRSHSEKYLNRDSSKTTVESAIAHLRSHHKEPYSPTSHLLSSSICAHAGNSHTRNASQTTGSLVAHLTQTNPIFWATATSAPCLSLFKPVWFDEEVIPKLGEERDSYWWTFEVLHRAVLKDFQLRSVEVKKEHALLQQALLDLVYKDGAKGYSVTKEAFERAQKLIKELVKKALSTPIKKHPNLYYRSYWKGLNKKANL